MSEPSRQDLEAYLARLRALDQYTRYHYAETWKPYPKQLDFIRLSATHRESMIFAGNQSGKTDVGAFATAAHLTGKYPNWWQGKRFDRPCRAWVCGDTAVTVRDIQQTKLCGLPGVEEAFGTGMIPRDCFVGKPTLSRGVSDAYDTIHVRHVSGGLSSATFKSYEQKRVKFQGEPLQFIWTDEECPMDIYTEILARITATRGIVFGTFTPLQGRTDLVCRYMEQSDPTRAYIMMSLTEAKHMTPQMIEDAIAGYPPHEREARIHGIPILGEGRVFPYDEALIREDPIRYIPDHWAKLWAVDFSHGGSHPFAAVLLLHDRDNDVIHVHHAFKVIAGPNQPGSLPINHAQAIMAVGGDVPVAWPHDGGITLGGLSSQDCLSIKEQYRACGLRMLATHATFKDGGFSTEAGIQAMQTRMQNGRFKVAAQLEPWWQEYRNYHRKDGLIVKINDDIMSATRIGVMAIRKAVPCLLGPGKPAWAQRADSRYRQVADGVDFPLT